MGDKGGVEVTVTNTSGATFSADRRRPATALALARRDAGDHRAARGLARRRTSRPGASTTRVVTFDPPALPDDVEQGQYTLRVDLYRKSTGEFFATKGNKPWEHPVKVKRVSTSDTLGLERFYHYEGEQLGGGMQHLTNLATGNSLVRFTPQVSTGRGLSTVVDLTYNSLEKRSESPLGNNWSVSISGLTRLGNPLDIHPNKLRRPRRRLQALHRLHRRRRHHAPLRGPPGRRREDLVRGAGRRPPVPAQVLRHRRHAPLGGHAARPRDLLLRRRRLPDERRGPQRQPDHLHAREHAAGRGLGQPEEAHHGDRRLQRP